MYRFFEKCEAVCAVFSGLVGQAEILVAQCGHIAVSLVPWLEWRLVAF